MKTYDVVIHDGRRPIEVQVSVTPAENQDGIFKFHGAATFINGEKFTIMSIGRTENEAAERAVKGVKEVLGMK